jgi:hypothetical protein
VSSITDEGEKETNEKVDSDEEEDSFPSGFFEEIKSSSTFSAHGCKEGSHETKEGCRTSCEDNVAWEHEASEDVSRYPGEEVKKEESFCSKKGFKEGADFVKKVGVKEEMEKAYVNNGGREESPGLQGKESPSKSPCCEEVFGLGVL